MTNRSTNVPRFSWAAVCARRLERHALSTPSTDARPAAIVSALCGAHAQVMSAAELSIGLRPGHGHGGEPRRALLRPEPRSQHHLHQPTPVAARIPDRRWTHRPHRHCQALPARLRTGHTPALRAVAGRTAAVGDGAVRLA